MYLDHTWRPVRALNAVKNHASGASAAGSGRGHRQLRGGRVGVAVDQARPAAQLADHRGDACGRVAPGDMAPASLVVDGHLHQSGGGVRGPRGPGARGCRTLVAVVVLRDQPTGDGDQAVLVVALTGGEDRLTAQRCAARTTLAAAEDEHVHPRVGVVGDGDGAATGGGRRPDERRGGAAALAHLPGLDAAAAVVGLPPGHGRPAVAYVVPVERVRRDDEHPTRLVHREAVRDRLALRKAHGPTTLPGVT